MRLRASLLLVTASAVTLVALAATRPRYGGTLRVQLAGPLPQLNPGAAHPRMRDRAFLEMVYQTLVRLNARGEPEPLLATSWQTDADRNRWRITLRSGVTLHDGSPFTPAAAAASLAPLLKAWFAADVAPGAQAIQISSDRPMHDLLERLADPAAAFPTGPFQIGSSDNGKITLNAFELHWAGRPFVDSIELLPSRSGAPPVSTAEVSEIAAGTPQRGIPDRTQIWSSAPAELLAIENAGGDPKLALRLSAAIDRISMAAVLTQRRAEPTAAVLPQWISGYAFVFSAVRDLAKARDADSAPVVLSYESTDALARTVAERVAVNARDAGLFITPRPDATGMLRMKRFPLGANGAESLHTVALELGLTDGFEGIGADPEGMYAAERRLLASGRVVPLMHVPLIFGFQPRVQVPRRPAPILPRLPFEDCWIVP